ncbi:MAG: hypothetical protein PHD97_03710 [Bacteroidales bacterium]|nr:hypothetical protein [Bacteroidales bacterium]
MQQNSNIEDFENIYKDMKTREPFHVPGNYFEKLPSEISDKIIKHNKKEIFDFIYSFNLPRILVYASFIIVIALIVGRNNFKKETNVELSSNEIAEVILNDDALMDSFDEETLVAELINEGNTDTLKNKNVQKSSSSAVKTEPIDEIFVNPEDTTITEEDIINYLNEDESIFINRDNETDN